MRFSANFQDFFKIQKIRNLKRIASQLFGVSQSSHRSYLLVKSHFCCFSDFLLKSDANFCSRNAAAIQFSSIIWKFYFLATQALHCKYFKCIWLSCRKQLHGSLNEKYLKSNLSSIFYFEWKSRIRQNHRNDLYASAC